MGSMPMNLVFPPPDEFGRVPTCPPPPGVTSNFDNPDSIGHRMIIACVVCSIVSVAFVGLRLHTRIHITRSAGMEDVFISIAWMICIGTAALNIATTFEGFGRHCWDAPRGPKLNILNWLASSLSILSNMFTKLAVVQLMVRIASHQKAIRWSYYGLMGFIIVWSLTTAGLIFFSCTPIKATWNRSIPGAKCLNLQKVFVPFGIIDVIISVLVFIAPFPLIWSSAKRLPMQQQIALFGIFAVGSLTWIVSSIRLNYTLENITDFTRSGIELVIWWTIETHVSIICACAFCLKPFAHRYFPNLSGFSSSGQSSARGHTTGNTNRIHTKGTRSSMGIAMHSMKIGGNKSRGFNTSVIVTNNDLYGERSGSEGELVGKDNYTQVESETGPHDADRDGVGVGNIVVERTWEVKVVSNRESV